MSKIIERKMAALDVAYAFADVDGEHHKTWVIDQMVRALTGDGYADWVSDYERNGEYTWDTGVAP